MEKSARDINVPQLHGSLAGFGFLLGVIAMFISGLFALNVTLVFTALFTAFWVAFYVNGHRLLFTNFMRVSIFLWVGYGILLIAKWLFLLIIY